MKHTKISLALPAWIVILTAVLFLTGCNTPTATPADESQPTFVVQPTASTAPVQPTNTAVPTEAPTTTPTTAPITSLDAFGVRISMSNPDQAVASNIDAALVEAKPIDPNDMTYGAHPAYAQFKLVGYALEKNSQLPFPLEGAQVMVYRTADFDKFKTDLRMDFPGRYALLKLYLGGNPNFENCNTFQTDYDMALPFLPWLNSKQSFCSHPEILSFENIRGMRYLTTYSQGIDPVIDPLVFYTFQGMTTDEQFYISAVFPIKTGVFPTEPPQGSPASLDDYAKQINEQLQMLTATEGDTFNPTLSRLDALVQSIRMAKP